MDRIRKLVAVPALAAALSLAALAAAGPASAANAPEGCEKVRGTIVCEEQDRAGRSDNFFTSSTSQKGSTNSSHEEECTFSNPSGKPRDC